MEVTISNEEKPDFLPFTLNIRLTSKESAHNLYKLLKPIIYVHDFMILILLNLSLQSYLRQHIMF